MPEVSLIIPTHNQCAALRRTLEALRQQTCPLEKLEVIVVADGCIDDTIKMLESWEAPFALRVIQLWGNGAATARNEGAQAAQGRLLIFLDDDIESMPGLIEAHVSAHQRQPDAVVIGYLPPVYPEPLDFFHLEARTWWESKFSTMRESGHRFNYVDMLSGNFSLRAELFARLGGFDTNFPGCGGEDYEFGVRLIKSGAQFVHAPEAMGYHHDKTGLDRSFVRARKEGQADVMIGRRHPELRPILLISKINSPWTRLAKTFSKLAISRPARGDRLARLFQRMLVSHERWRRQNRWRKLYGVLRAYWYWRGAMEELGNPDELKKFLNEAPANNPGADHQLDIDLRAGLELAERRLNKERPAKARLRYGQQHIGGIPLQLGAERLRGEHLRPILAKNFTWPLLVAMASEDGAWQRVNGATNGGVRLFDSPASSLSQKTHAIPA